jgi:hypothetical protein
LVGGNDQEVFAKAKKDSKVSELPIKIVGEVLTQPQPRDLPACATAGQEIATTTLAACAGFAKIGLPKPIGPCLVTAITDSDLWFA